MTRRASRPLAQAVAASVAVAAAIAAAVAATPNTPGAAANTRLRLPQGELQGSEDRGLWVFKGIPYATPPVGELRWRSPQLPPSWKGLRAATDFGPVCPQVLRPGSAETEIAQRPMAEDCLYLNVWTPDRRADARRPVMVWLLPGGFRSGDASMPVYDGASLARRGVVVVSFNYRLGILGEFAHPALRHTQGNEPRGNYNLQDQMAALRWVRANVAAFGGDPGNVTIFGMSAGGMSVNYLMASPASAGLFDKAISQSSALRMSQDRKLTEDQPGMPSLETEGQAHATKLGIIGDAANRARQLRALSWRELLDYQSRNPLGTAGGLSPVIDGVTLTEAVGATFRAGRQHRVPYMTGATNWEGSLVKGGPSALAPVLTLLNLTRAAIDPVYELANEEHLAWEIYTDFFLASQRYLAQAHARTGAPTYLYRFSRTLTAHRSELYGAAHGTETRYVFHTLDGLARIANASQPGDAGYLVSDADRAYADIVARYWVNFATHGDPNSDGLPGWPTITPTNDLALEFLPSEPEVRRDLLKARWELFREHFDAGRL